MFIHMNQKVYITSSNVRTLILFNFVQYLTGYKLSHMICHFFFFQCDNMVRHKGISVFYQELMLWD